MKYNLKLSAKKITKELFGFNKNCKCLNKITRFVILKIKDYCSISMNIMNICVIQIAFKIILNAKILSSKNTRMTIKKHSSIIQILNFKKDIDKIITSQNLRNLKNPNIQITAENLFFSIKNNIIIIFILLLSLHIITKNLSYNLYKTNTMRIRFMHRIKNYAQIKNLPIKFENIKPKYVINYHIDLLHRIILLGQKSENLSQKDLIIFMHNEFQKISPEFSLTKSSFNTLFYILRYNPQKFMDFYENIKILRGIGTENASSTSCELNTLLHFPFPLEKYNISYLPQNSENILEKKLMTNQANPDFSINNMYYDVKNYNIKTNSNTIIHLTLFRENNELICQNYLNKFTLKSLLSTAQSQYNYLTDNIHKFTIKDQQLILQSNKLFLKTKNDFNMENYNNLQENILNILQPMLWDNYKIIMHNLIICFHFTENSRIIHQSIITHNFKDIKFTKTSTKPLNDFIVEQLKKHYNIENLLNKAYCQQNSNLLLNLSDNHIIKTMKSTHEKINKMQEKKYADYWDTISVSKGVRLLAEKIQSLP